MAEHKNAAMIKAKANNMDLVVFAKSEKWHEVDADDYQFFNQHEDYFVCLPQHKVECLHWLNGGEVQAMHFENQMPDSGVMFDSGLVDLEESVESYQWKFNHIFMQEHEIIIKPRKEKRWIIALPTRLDSRRYYHSKEAAEGAISKALGDCSNAQVIEIEVVVVG